LIEAVLASHQVSLKVSPTCNNVGTEPSDATIGRYLAGFLAEMQDGDDVWSWGVRFKVRQSDGLVLPDSFECTGAG
jgi:hypothetical protein